MALPGENMGTDHFANLPDAPVVEPAKYQLAQKLIHADNNKRRELLIEARVEASEIIAIMGFLEKVVPMALSLMM